MVRQEDFKKNVPLKNYVTFKLGGAADLFFEARTSKELAEAARLALSQNIEYFILGGGSNLVVSDRGVSGLVIRNISSDIEKVDKTLETITLSSGFSLSHLVELASENGFSGAEVFAGIPGSVGGAVCGNAGAYGRDISDILTRAEVIFPDGSSKIVNRPFFEYEYRSSRLKKERGFIVVAAEFKLVSGEYAQITKTVEKILAERALKHPPKEIGSAGSFFKNLPPQGKECRRHAAGALLEQIGAKAMFEGGASVYEKHANFIINKGFATSSDVKKLAVRLKQKVFEKFKVKLQEEVLYIGRDE